MVAGGPDWAASGSAFASASGTPTAATSLPAGTSAPDVLSLGVGAAAGDQTAG